MQEFKTGDWIAKYNRGVYELNTRDRQCNAGWYDWFCKDSSLCAKTKKMGRIIAKITNPAILNLTYVWFKNNCPAVGNLYDDFRFARLDTGDTLFTISIDAPSASAKYSVWCFINNFSEPYITFNTTAELLNFLNTVELRF